MIEKAVESSTASDSGDHEHRNNRELALVPCLRFVSFQSFAASDQVRNVIRNSVSLYQRAEATPTRAVRRGTKLDPLVTYVEFLTLRQLVDAGHAEQIEKAVGRIVQRFPGIFVRSFDAQQLAPDEL